MRAYRPRAAPGVHRRHRRQGQLSRMSENFGRGKNKAWPPPARASPVRRGNDLLDAQSQRMVAVMERLHHDRPDFAASSAISRASAALAVNGFSHSTCLPVRGAARIHRPSQAVRQRNVGSVEDPGRRSAFRSFRAPGRYRVSQARPCARGIARRHCGDDDLDVSLGRLDERQRCDARCAQDADPPRGGPVSRHERDASACPGSVGDTRRSRRRLTDDVSVLRWTNRVCSSGRYIYQRFSGEADHEHTSPVAGADVHILRRGNKYSAAGRGARHSGRRRPATQAVWRLGGLAATR